MSSPTQDPIFRPSKRRKTATQHRSRREFSPSDHDDPREQPRPSDDNAEEADADEDFSKKFARLRARLKKHPMNRDANVSAPLANSSSSHEIEGLVYGQSGIRNDHENIGLSSRFAPSSGGIADQRKGEEKHLTAYIDSHLNLVKPTPSAQTAETLSTIRDQESSTSEASSFPEIQASSAITARPAKSATIQGKLEEIDLSVTVRPSSDAQKPGEPLDEDSSVVKPRKKLPPKVRVNRYGKVLPQRKRKDKQRDEENVMRDKRVEEMLATAASGEVPRTGDDAVSGEQKAPIDDEQFAEQFRREYLENAKVADVPKANPATAKGKAIGPKLGGSRSARAKAQRGR